MNRWAALFWISLSEWFALSLWFSASAILPELRVEWDLEPSMEAWIASAVQIGFIIGALVSSYLGLADRINARKLFAMSAIIGAASNGLLILVDDAYVGLALRILTGISLAGVYPTAVKLLAQWFPKQRGMAIGILIAALSLGSAFPHLVYVLFASVQWEMVIAISSLLAAVSSFVMMVIQRDAPVPTRPTVISMRLLRQVLANRSIMLTNLGYFGHMWELYAMWTWLPLFLRASLDQSAPGISTAAAPLIAFLSIGVAGAAGCIIGGYYADRIGRARLTILAMGISGCCAIAIGFTFGGAI
ncbi:MFS transporter [Paenibacillus sp. strain BS8-2]